LEAGDYFVLCSNAAIVNNCDLDVSPDTNLIQNGSRDAVALTLDNAIIDAVSYEGNSGTPYIEGSGFGLEDPWSNIIGGPEEDKGLSRYPDGMDTDQNNIDFIVSCITPGEANIQQGSDCFDIEPPQITRPADLTVECGESTDPEATGWVTATDETDPNPIITFSDSITSDYCPQESVMVRTWTATDETGKSSSCDQVITVADTTAPVIELIGDDMIILETHIDTYEESGATVSDNCNTSTIEAMIGGDVVDTNTPGEYVVTYSATDACGNEAAQVLRMVIVEDTTPQEVIADDITSFIGTSVADASLVGQGSGKSADKKLNASRNMIEEAGNLIQDGLIDDTCQQLSAAFKKTDGQDKPPDFVSGSATDELAGMIQELLNILGCP